MLTTTIDPELFYPIYQPTYLLIYQPARLTDKLYCVDTSHSVCYFCYDSVTTQRPPQPLPIKSAPSYGALAQDAKAKGHVRQLSTGTCASSDEEEKVRTRRAEEDADARCRDAGCTESSVPPSPSVSGSPIASPRPVRKVESVGTPRANFQPPFKLFLQSTTSLFGSGHIPSTNYSNPSVTLLSLPPSHWNIFRTLFMKLPASDLTARFYERNFWVYFSVSSFFPHFSYSVCLIS